jgi:hypothetical protein
MINPAQGAELLDLSGKRQVIALTEFYPFGAVYKIVVNIRASRTSM